MPKFKKQLAWKDIVFVWNLVYLCKAYLRKCTLCESASFAFMHLHIITKAFRFNFSETKIAKFLTLKNIEDTTDAFAMLVLLIPRPNLEKDCPYRHLREEWVVQFQSRRLAMPCFDWQRTPPHAFIFQQLTNTASFDEAWETSKQNHA